MASTVIGAGITIEGEVTSDEDVVVQGTLRGKLVAKDAVTIEHGGVVEADIAAGPVSIAGAVTGNITSNDRVDLQNGAEGRGQREGHAYHDRRRRPVQGQRRHGRVRWQHSTQRRQPPSLAAALSFADASPAPAISRSQGASRARSRARARW